MSIQLPGKVVFRERETIETVGRLISYELCKTFGSDKRLDDQDIQLCREHGRAWAESLIHLVGSELYKDFGKSRNVKWSGRLRRALEFFGWRLPADRLSDVMSRAFITVYANGLNATCQPFDWVEGEYGDEGSCFFTERRVIRDLINQIGVVGVTFHFADTGRPAGRCFAVQAGDDVLLFNFYAKHNSKDLWEYVAQYINPLNPSGVCPTVWLDAPGIVYINYKNALRVPAHVFGDLLTGFPRAYEVRRDESTSRQPDIDRYYLDCDEADDYTICEGCYYWFYKGGDEVCQGANGHLYCSQDCMPEIVECEACGHLMHDGDQWVYGGDNLCSSCYDERVSEPADD